MGIFASEVVWGYIMRRAHGSEDSRALAKTEFPEEKASTTKTQRVSQEILRRAI